MTSISMHFVRASDGTRIPHHIHEDGRVMAEVNPGDDLFVEAVVQQNIGVKYGASFYLNGVEQGGDILLNDCDGKVRTYKFGKYCNESKAWCSILMQDKKPEDADSDSTGGTVGGTVEEVTGVVELKIVRCEAVPCAASSVDDFTFKESNPSNVESEGDKKKDDLYACKGGKMRRHGMSNESITDRYETTAQQKLYFGSDFLCTNQKFKTSGIKEKDRIGPNSMAKKRKKEGSSSSASENQKMSISEAKKELPNKSKAKVVDLTGSDDEDVPSCSKKAKTVE